MLGRGAVERLGSLGLAATAGVARTPLLARYAAHLARPVLEVDDERGFLAALPLSLADPPAALAAILRDWGVGTLGALTALPKPDVARRLGRAGVELWERAAGETDRPIEPLPDRGALRGRDGLGRGDRDPRAPAVHPPPVCRPPGAPAGERGARRGGNCRSSCAWRTRPSTGGNSGCPSPPATRKSCFGRCTPTWRRCAPARRLAGVGLAVSPTRPLARQGGIFEAGLRDPHAFLRDPGAASRRSWDRAAWGRPAPSRPTGRTPSPWKSRPRIVGAPPAPPALPPIGLPLRRFRPPLEAGVQSDGPAAGVGAVRRHPGPGAARARALAPVRRVVEARALGPGGMGCRTGGRRPLPPLPDAGALVGRGDV